MGARPEQQLALTFLSAVHHLWIQHPGTYVVTESTEDLVLALAQMCIKALAADVRDDPFLADKQSEPVNGRLVNNGQILAESGSATTLTLHDVLNKVIHGTPTLVVVQEGDVRLYFESSSPDRWTEAWFSGTEVLEMLNVLLYKHRTNAARAREHEITEFLSRLGVGNFLPTRT